jgi:hypothetical protein
MFSLVAVGVLLVTFNAVRPVPGATASDLIFVLAVLNIGVAFLDPEWKLGRIAPTWLIAAGGLLFVAALLVGIFPARPSRAALLFPTGILASGSQWVPQPNLSNMSAAVRFVGALVFIPILIAAVANSRRRIKIVAEMWIAGAALGALVACLEYAGLVSLNDPFFLYAGHRVTGLTDHPNTLGLVSAMALPVAASRLGGSDGRARLYYSAAAASMISGIAVSGSRAAIVGAILGLVLVGALHREGRRGFRRTAFVTLMLVTVVVVALSPPPALERLLHGSDPAVAGSTQLRAESYPAVWHEILQRPIVGHGFEYIRGAHDIYLQLLHAGGVIALAGFLSFAVGITVTGLRLGRAIVVPDDLRSLARASVASLGVWLVAGGLVSTAIFDRYLYIPAGLITAIWVLRRRSVTERPPDISVSSELRVSQRPDRSSTLRASR